MKKSNIKYQISKMWRSTAKVRILWLGLVLFFIRATVIQTQEITNIPNATPNFWELIKQKRISIDFKNTDLDDALRLLSQQNNINFYTLHKVKGKKINFYFKDVPLADLLKTILSQSGFDYAVFPEKNIIEVAAARPEKMDTRILSIKNAEPLQMKTLIANILTPQGAVSIDRDSRVAMITDTYQNFNRIIEVVESLDIKPSSGPERSPNVTGEQQTKVFTLQYASASKIKDIVAKSLSANGNVEVDEGLNALIIKDAATSMEQITELLLKLDQETPQVIISAELVEINSGVLHELGAKWIYQPGSHGQTFTLHNQYNTPPLGEDTENLGFITQPLGVSLVYGEVTEKLRAMITALITTSKAEILSNPMITVVNNEKAKIEITEKFPYAQFSGYDAKGNPQYSTEFIDVGIIMSVTPHIREGNIVNLELEPEVSFEVGERIGIPIRATRKAATKVNVRDGKTIVIGGLTSNRQRRTVYKVPILGSIPLLGQLFRSNKDSIDKVDLMIFVTPRIVTSSRIEDFSQEKRMKLQQN